MFSVQQQNSSSQLNNLKNKKVSIPDTNNSLQTLPTTKHSLTSKKDLPLLQAQKSELQLKNQEEEEKNASILTWVNELQIPLTDDLTPEELVQQGLLSSKQFQFQSETYTLRETLKNETEVRKSDKFGERHLEKYEQNQLLYTLKQECLFLKQKTINEQFSNQDYSNISYGLEKEEQQQDEELQNLESKLNAIEDLLIVADKNSSTPNNNIDSLQGQVDLFLKIGIQLYEQIDGDNDKWEAYMDDMVIGFLEEQDEEFYELFAEFLYDFDDLKDFLENVQYDYDFELEYEDINYDFEEILQSLQKEVASLKSAKIQVQLDEIDVIKKQIREKKTELKKLKHSLATDSSSTDISQEAMDELQDLVEQQRKKAEEAFQNITDEGEQQRRKQKYLDAIKKKDYEVSQEQQYLKEGQLSIENTTNSILQSTLLRTENQQKLSQIENIQQFSLEQQNQITEFLLIHTEKVYKDQLTKEIKAQEDKIQSIIDNLNPNSTEQDKWHRIYEDEILKVQQHQLNSWVPMMKKRETQKTLKNQNVQLDLDSQSINLGKEISNQNQFIQGQQDLLENPNTGYLTVQKKTLLRYEQGQIVQVVTSLDDKEGLKTISAALTKELEEYKQKQAEFTKELQSKRDVELPKVEENLAKISENIEKQMENLTYQSLKYFKTKQGSEQYYEIQADYFIEKVDQIMLNTVTSVIDYVGIEKATNMIKTQIKNVQKVSDFTAFEALISEICKKLLLVVCLQEISLDFSGVASNIVKLSTYNGTYKLSIAAENLEKIKKIAPETLTQDAEKIKIAFFETYKTLGIDSNSIKNSGEIQKILENRKPQRNLEKYVSIKNVAFEEPILGLKLENQLQNSIDFVIQIDPEHKNNPAEVIVRKTNINDNLIHTTTENIVKDICDFLSKNEAKLSAKGKEILKTIDQAQALKFFKEWISDITESEKLLDLDDILFNSEGNNKHLSNLFTLYFQKDLILQKVEIFEQINQKTELTKQKQQLNSNINLILQQQQQNDKQIEVIQSLVPIATNPPAETEEKDLFPVIGTHLQDFKNLETEAVKKISSEIAENQKQIKENQEIQSQNKFKIEEKDYETVIFPTIIDKHFVYKYIVLTEQKWENIPNSNNEQQLLLLQEARELTKIMAQKVNNDELNIDEDLKKFKIDQLGKELTAKVGDKGSYLVGSILRKVCVQIKDGFKSIRNEQRQSLDHKIISLHDKGQYLENIKDSLQLMENSLEKKVSLVQNFVEFLKDPTNIGNLEEYQDLLKYQHQLFVASLKFQLSELQVLFTYLNDSYLKKIENKDHLNAIYTQFGNFFKSEYFSSIDLSKPEQIIPNINQNLKEESEKEIPEKKEEFNKIQSEINKNYNSTIWLQSVLRKLEISLKSIPEIEDLKQILQQNDGDDLNLYKVYTVLLNQHRIEQQEKIHQQIKELENTIKTLQASLKDSYLKDWVSIRFEKECADSIIFYIDNYRDMDYLWQRIKNTQESETQVNLYQFTIDGETYIVQLFKEGVEAQNEEKNEIQRIKKLIEDNNNTISKKKGQKEIYQQRAQDIKDDKFPELIKIVNQELFTQGIVMTGFQIFDNEEELSEVDSLVAVLVDRIIEETSLFWYGGKNQTTSDLQGRIKKIRVILGEDFKKFSTKEEEFKKQYEQVLKAVNEEYSQDNLAIKSLKIKEKGVENLIEIQDSEAPVNGSNLLLVQVQRKFYSLISVSDWYNTDQELQMSIIEKYDYIQTLIQQDSRLFQQICRYRLSDILGESYTQSDNFVAGYKAEVNFISNIPSLDQFLSLSTQILSSNSTLYTYLCLYNSIYQEIQSSDSLLKKYKEIYKNSAQSPLKILKQHYKQSLLDVAVEEQLRRKKYMESMQDSSDKEQQYWQDQLEESMKTQQELEDLLAQMQEDMQETQDLLNGQLEEMKKQQEKYEQMLEKLEEEKKKLKEDLEASKQELERLKQEEEKNKEEIKKTEEEIAKKEAEIAEKQQEIEEQQQKEQELEQEIQEIADKIDRLELDKQKKEAEQKELEEDLAEKKEEIQACSAFLTIQDNLEKMLKIYENYQKRDLIQEYIATSDSFLEMIQKAEEKQEYKDIWTQLIQDISQEDFKVFQDFLTKKKTFFGKSIYELQQLLSENCHYLLKINIEPKEESLTEDLKVFKIRAPILSLQALSVEVKKVLELQMKKAQSGLFFDPKNDLLKCDSIDKIENLPEKFQKLIQKRIELHYLNKSYEQDPRKTAKGEEAKTIINELEITYKEVLRCFVDELFIIADKFYLDSQDIHFPGVDFSLNSTIFEVVGAKALINVSGLEGKKFLNEYAASGEQLREGKDPQGQKGADGYDGQDGMNSGNVVLKIEQKMINQEGLQIYAAGGKGGEAQFGGDGDAGIKGERGKPGKAPNTEGMGGQQICIGFGTLGKVGGDGGAPGKTGRPGRGGYAGDIYIQLREYEITNQIEISAIDGVEGDDILDENYPSEKPLQGEPGLGGLPGFDQLKVKKSFFHKTQTDSKIYIDTGRLKEFCQENGHKKQIPKVEKRQNIKMTNKNFLLGFLITLGCLVVGALGTIVLGPAGIAAGITLAGAGWAALGGAIIGLCGGFIAGAFGSTLETESISSLDSIRNNTKEQNEVKQETKQRQDEREAQEQKRQERNAESMNQEYNDLQNEKSEIFMEDIFRQYMQKLESDKQSIDQSIKETQSTIDIINGELAELAQEKLSKEMELEIIKKMINRLSEEIEAIQEELKESQQNLQNLTEEGKKIRDQRLQEQQHLQEIVNQLNLAVQQGLDYNDIKQELDTIVNQYIDMLEAKLASQKEEMSQLQEELEEQILASQEFKNKIQEMQNASDISQAIQEEIDQIQQELAEDVDIEINIDNNENPDVIIPSDQGQIAHPSELPYIVSNAEFYKNLSLNLKDLQETKKILVQSLRDFRAKTIDQQILNEKIINVLKTEAEKPQIDQNIVQIYENYSQKVEEIQLKWELEQLPEAEKMLFVQTLTKIYNVLYQDSFQIIDQEYQASFLFGILEQDNLKNFATIQSLKQKINDRKYDIYYMTNDQIVQDLARILSILRSSQWFYLEDCSKNAAEIEEFSDFEKKIVSFNKASSLENVLALLKEYEKLEKAKKTVVFEQSAFWNLKQFAVSQIYAIREQLTSKREDKSDLLEKIENFKNSIQILSNAAVSDQLKPHLQQILPLLAKFTQLSTAALDDSKTKKLANKLLKLLKKITIKILFFYPDAKFQELNAKFLSEDFKIQANQQQQNEQILEDFLHEIEETQDKILYSKEENPEDAHSELSEPDEDPLDLFLTKYTPLLSEQFKAVETMKTTEINAFLIDIFQNKSLQTETEQEIEKTMNSLIENAYFTSQISILRIISDQDLEKVGKLLGYDLKNFKALIAVNTYNPDLSKQLREKQAEIKKILSENEINEDNPYEFALDLQYKMLIYQQDLNDIDLSSFELKFSIRFKKIADQIDMDKISDLLQYQSLSSEDEKLTVEERIFQKLDQMQPYILIQVLLFLQDQVTIQQILKQKIGQNVVSVESVVENEDLFSKIEEIIAEKPDMDSFVSEIGEEYKEKSTIQKDLNLPILYLQNEYEVAIAILENCKLTTEEIETKLNNPSTKPVVFLVLKQEYQQRNDLETEKMAKLLASILITPQQQQQKQEKQDEDKLKQLGEIQYNTKLIIKGRQLFQAQPGSFTSLSLYKQINENIVLYKEDLNKLQAYIKQQKEIETQYELEQIFTAYNLTYQNEDQKSLFNTFIKIFKDIALAQKQLSEDDLARLIFQLSQLIDALKSPENEAFLQQNLYDLIDFISQNSTKNEQNKDQLQTTLQFLIKKADMLSLGSVYNTFTALEKTESQKLDQLNELKKSLKFAFSQELKVIIDKQKRQNYAIFFSLYLEKLELLYAPAGTDLTCQKRLEKLTDFQKTIEKLEENPVDKYLDIEKELADLLEDLVLKDGAQEKEVFSLEFIENKLKSLADLKLKVLQVQEDIEDSPSDLVKEGKGIKIEDLFDSFGQLDSQREDFEKDLKKIIIFEDETQRKFYIFYKYPNDSFSDPESVSDLIDDLQLIQDKYQILKFKDKLESWNDKDRLSKLYVKYLLEGIQYYFLRVKPEESVENLQLLADFSEGLTRMIENLILNEERDEEILQNLRVSIDYFYEFVLQDQLNDENNTENYPILRKIEQSIYNLRLQVVYKSYKEQNLANIVEEQEEFLQKKKPSTLKAQLQIIWNKLLELVLERAELGINDKGNFYVQLLEELKKDHFVEVSLEDFDQISAADVHNVIKFIEDYQNSIILQNLDPTSANIGQFIKKINENTLKIPDLLNKPNKDERKQTVKNLKLILLDKENGQKLTSNKVKELIISLNSEEDLEFLFIQDLLKLYSENAVKELKETYQNKLPTSIDIEVYTQQIFSKLFDAFQYQEQNSDSASLQLIVQNIDLTVTKIKEILDKNAENPEEDLGSTLNLATETIEIDFIISILQLKNNIFSPEILESYKKLSEKPEKTRFLALLGLLPGSFFQKGIRSDFKAFILQSIADYRAFTTKKEEDNQEKSQNEAFFSKLSNLIFEYCRTYFKEFIQGEGEEEQENTNKWKIQDNIESLMTLSYNTLPLDFLSFTEQKMLEKQEIKEKNDYNYVISLHQIYNNNTGSLTSVIPFMSLFESQNLRKVLKIKEEEVDLKEAILALEKDPKQEQLLEKLTYIFQNPIISWYDQLTELRFTQVKDLILNQASFDQQNSSEKDNNNKDNLADSVKILQFLSFQNSIQDQALAVLELIEQNLPKFNQNVNEIKRCINEIAYLQNFDQITALIEGNRKHVTFDILFNRLQSDDNEELKNSITRLKIALSAEKFIAVEYFCAVFVMKIQELDSDQGVSEVIDYIVKSKLFIKDSLISKIKEKEFLSWKQDLEKEIIRQKIEITKFRSYRYTQKEKMVELLYQIQQEKGVEFYQYLFNSILRKIETIKMQRVLGQLNKILYSDLKIQDLDSLKDEAGKIKDITLWDDILYPKTDNQADTDVLSVEELLALMQQGDKIKPGGFNYSRKDIVTRSTPELDIVPILESALDMTKPVTQFSHLSEELKKKPVNDWKKEDLTAWSKAYLEQEDLKNIDLFNMHNESFRKELLIETFRVINKGIQLFKGYYPRNNILMANIFFMANREGKVGSLGNIATGEGKTTLTIILAIIHALCGLKIDILTSNKVLAIRDSQPFNAETGEGWRDFYAWFGVKCNNNCDAESEDPRQGDTVKKTRYASCQVIYGEAGYFQRDILLTEFFGKGIRPGKSTADVIILDEVDNMMIDNAVKTLYISHKINDFRYLKDVFIRIWFFVNGADSAYNEENIQGVEKNIRQITRVLDEVMVNFDTLKATLDKISSAFPELFCGKQKEIFRFLQGEATIQISEQQDINIQLVDSTEFIRNDIIKALELIVSNQVNYNTANFDLLLEKLALKKTESQQFNEDLIFIPKTLTEFVNSNLKPWIENAFYAKFIKADDSYIIGDNESAGPGLAIIMDKDTGVEQNSTKWSRGLHQFIQLKHNLKLSDESLKAVYLSNLNYFKKYKKLYGMSGTVGDKDERSLIGTSYNTDFFEVPRFKKYRFKYDADVESVAVTQEEWLQNLVENVDENVAQEIDYTEEYKADIEKNLEKFRKEKTENTEQLQVYLTESNKLEEQLKQVQNSLDKLTQIEKLSFDIISTGNIILDFEQKKTAISDIIAQLDQIFTEVPEELSDLVAKFKPILEPFNSYVNEFDLDKKVAHFASDLSSLQLSTQKNEKIEQKDTISDQIKDQSVGITYLRDQIASLTSEIAAYEQELNNTTNPENKDPHRRPILIICENITSVETIHKKISKEFPTLNIFIYDRAYRKFDKMKLDEGDIVIATNIAGRGTSFKVTEKAEKNGGLHVIVSFMSQNIRVEQQAFGRTARGGKKGTGTFIVLDTRGEDQSIPELKRERNEKEQLRLQNVQQKQFPKIEKEDSLFLLFNELKKQVTTKLIEIYKKQSPFFLSGTELDEQGEQYVELQIDSLKNKFAVWLSQLEEKLQNVYQSEENQTEIDQLYQEFKTYILSLLNISKNPFLLIDEPAELSKLGRYYYDYQNYSKAIQCFNEVIQNHPEFQEIAQYYRSFALIHRDGGHLSSKINAKNALKKALPILERQRNNTIMRNQIQDIVNEFRASQGDYSGLKLFHESNERTSELIQVQINSILSQTGQIEINSESFKSAIGAAGDIDERFYKELSKDEYGLVKNRRISKKVVVASEVFVQDENKVKQILTENKGKNAEICEKLLQNLSIFSQNKYLTYQILHNNLKFDFETSKKTINLLFELEILRKQQLFKNKTKQNLNQVINSSEKIQFPNSLYQQQQQILFKLDQDLQISAQEDYFYQKRQVSEDYFNEFIYTKDQYLEESKGLVQEKTSVKLNPYLERVMLGKPDHEVYKGKGDKLKEILKEKINKIEKQKIAIEFKILEIQQQIYELPMNEENYKEKIDNLMKTQEAYQEKMQELYTLDAETFQQELIEKLELNKEEVEAILNHLENYEYVNPDFKLLENSIEKAKNQDIFFAIKKKILEFCTGKTEITLKRHQNKKIKLKDNLPYSVPDLQNALMQMIVESIVESQIQDPNDQEERENLTENTYDLFAENSQTPERSDFNTLLIVLGFSSGTKEEVLSNTKELILQNREENLKKIEEYLAVIDLSQFQDKQIQQLKEVDFSSFSEDLAKEQAKIKEILIENKGKQLKREDFLNEEEQKLLNQEEFSVLRDALIDFSIIKSSILAHLRGETQVPQTIIEQEIISKSLYESQGVLDEKNLLLKSAKQGSKEIIERFLVLNVLKPSKMNFPLSNKPNKFEQHYLQSQLPYNNNVFPPPTRITPEKRLNLIKSRLDTILDKVYKTHQDKDDRSNEKDKIMENVQEIVGTIKSFLKIKVKEDNIEEKFPEGGIPPEYLDLVDIAFEKIFKFVENKGFDWDAFWCSMLGLLQVVIGCAIMYFSAGSLTILAKAFIEEGISDISYAVCAAIEGNFSWKTYATFKLIGIVTTGLSAGLSAVLPAVGAGAKIEGMLMASKSVIMKAIAKQVFMESVQGVINGIVSFSVGQLSTMIYDLLFDKFKSEFESWRDDSMYNNDVYRQSEQIMYELYDTYGMDAEDHIIKEYDNIMKELADRNLLTQIDETAFQIVDKVGAQLRQKAQDLKKKGKLGKLAGGFLYTLRATAYGYEQIKGIQKLCALCGKINSKFLEKLQKLKERLKDEIEIDDSYRRKVEREREKYNFKEEVNKLHTKINAGMENEYKEIVLRQFLKPAIQFHLNHSINFIRSQAEEKLFNPKKDLEKYINNKADSIGKQIEAQTKNTVFVPSQKAIKALEQLGRLQSLPSLKEKLGKKNYNNIIKDKDLVTNFPGISFKKLQKQHGDDLRIYIKNEKYYAVLPSFQSYCATLQSSNIQGTSRFTIKIAADHEDSRINVHQVTKFDANGDPIIGSKFEHYGNNYINEPYKIALVHPKDGKKSYYAPIIQDAFGNYKVVTVGKGSKSFVQAMIYIKTYRKNKDESEANAAATNTTNIKDYYNNLGQSALNNQSIKDAYNNGWTINTPRQKQKKKQKEEEHPYDGLSDKMISFLNKRYEAGEQKQLQIRSTRMLAVELFNNFSFKKMYQIASQFPMTLMEIIYGFQNTARFNIVINLRRPLPIQFKVIDTSNLKGQQQQNFLNKVKEYYNKKPDQVGGNSMFDQIKNAILNNNIRIINQILIQEKGLLDIFESEKDIAMVQVPGIQSSPEESPLTVFGSKVKVLTTSQDHLVNYQQYQEKNIQQDQEEGEDQENEEQEDSSIEQENSLTDFSEIPDKYVENVGYLMQDLEDEKMKYKLFIVHSLYNYVLYMQKHNFVGSEEEFRLQYEESNDMNSIFQTQNDENSQQK